MRDVFSWKKTATAAGRSPRCYATLRVARLRRANEFLVVARSHANLALWIGLVAKGNGVVSKGMDTRIFQNNGKTLSLSLGVSSQVDLGIDAYPTASSYVDNHFITILRCLRSKCTICMPGFHLYLCLYWATMHHSISSTQEVKLRTLRPCTSWKHFQTCYCVNHRFPRFLVRPFLQQLPNRHREPHFLRGGCQLFQARGQCDLPILCEVGKESWTRLGHRCGPMDSLHAWGPPGNNGRFLKQTLAGNLLDQQSSRIYPFSQVLALSVGVSMSSLMQANDVLRVVVMCALVRLLFWNTLDAMICKVCNRIGK